MARVSEAEQGGQIWIETVPAEKAEGVLRDLYDRRSHTGNMFQALTLWPEVLAARDEMMRAVFRPSLGTRRRELLFTVCAVLIGCDFCTHLHGKGVRRAGFDDEQVETLKRDYRRVELDPAERQMLDYAALLTVAPWRIEESHVEALRAAGWDDRKILEINQVCSYMNMVGRTNRGLGVDAAGNYERDYEPEAALLRAQIIAGEAP
jgi:uncharacterized peroxidase-related enzyme